MLASVRSLIRMRRRGGAGQGRSARHRLRVPLTLEALEDRFLPSVYAVINTDDSGGGSLRQAILDANAHTSEANTIIFDIRGQGPQTIRPLSSLPTITNPVIIDATYQPGYAGTPLIELAGKLAGSNANGLTIAANNSVVRGLDIDLFGGDGVILQGNGDHIEGCYLGISTAAIAGTIAPSDHIEGCYLGISTGTLRQGNATGVYITGSDDVVGGTALGAGNLISGNGSGVAVVGNNNVVQGNTIGTDITGTHVLGNQVGVNIDGGADNLVGGTALGAGNLISGNTLYGVAIFSSNNNVVQGNLIGTDVTGTQPLYNGQTGVFIDGGAGNLVGGTAAGAGNLISGNSGVGVEIFVSNNNVVQGNLIGTDVTGTQALGNTIGIAIINGSGNTVGGTTAAAANVISGNEVLSIPAAVDVISANNGYGVFISGTNAQSNLIEGNFIGTDVSATLNLGNGADGVTIQDASNNLIGGTAAGAGNVIAFNGNDGVLVDGGSGNVILSDLIFANSNLGIELLHNGNNNQAAPLLTGAFSDGPNTVIQGVLQSTPNTTFTVQLFSDPSADPNGQAEGQQLLGTVTVTTDAFGFAAFTVTVPNAVPPGQVVTATATDAGNNTSEFSDPVMVTAA